MKLRYFILFLFASVYGNAQNKFLDYIVTDNNDTIYGTIRQDYNYFLFERTAGNTAEFKQHKFKNIKALRYWDKEFSRKPKRTDPIYEEAAVQAEGSAIYYHFLDFVSQTPALKDYVVPVSGDTIFGIVNDRAFDKVLISDSGEKFMIEKENVKGYRMRNRTFVLMDKQDLPQFGDKKVFVELLLDGKAKLYVHSVANNASINLGASGLYYMVYKDKELHFIEPEKASQLLSGIFADNAELQKKILEKEYTLQSIYLIVKYYNESKL